MKKIIALLLVLITLFSCTSCELISTYLTPTPKYIKTTGLSLSQTKIIGYKEDVFILSATVTPVTATNQTVAWESENPEIASVSPIGLVKLHDIGETIITATAADGQKAYCYVQVEHNIEHVTISLTRENFREYLSLRVEQSGGLMFYLYPRTEYDSATFSNVSLTIEGTIIYDAGSMGQKNFTHKQYLKTGWVSSPGAIRYCNYEITNVTGTISFYVEH